MPTTCTTTDGENRDWRHRAVCRDEDPELFFPVGHTGPVLQQIAEAKAVCRRCPVASDCLAWALESGQDHGVWGGMSEDERRALKRRNARIRASTGDDQKKRRPKVADVDVELLLQRLDADARVADVAQQIGITTGEALVIWREHRDTLAPHGQGGGSW